MNPTKTKWTLLDLQGMPLLEQLQLEEALLRVTDENFLLLNRGKEPTFVMGISGKRAHLFHDAPYPIIRRYSGGGAVLVDEGTLLVSFIGQKGALLEEVTPSSLHHWAFSHWKKAFHPHPLSLRENDFCLGEKKIGGNAQYLTRTRFVHHSTFLWDFSEERMALVKMPPKMPLYRENRDHSQFLDRLHRHFDAPSSLMSRLEGAFGEEYGLERKPFHSYLSYLLLPHRKATTLLI